MAQCVPIIFLWKSNPQYLQVIKLPCCTFWYLPSRRGCWEDSASDRPNYTSCNYVPWNSPVPLNLINRFFTLSEFPYFATNMANITWMYEPMKHGLIILHSLHVFLDSFHISTEIQSGKKENAQTQCLFPCQGSFVSWEHGWALKRWC